MARLTFFEILEAVSPFAEKQGSARLSGGLVKRPLASWIGGL
jgi:hypothetical protein